MSLVIAESPLGFPFASSFHGLGADAESIREKVEALCRDSVSVRFKTRTLEDRFRDAVTHWEEATAHLSSIAAMALDPHYQRIVGMGHPVVPLLLREMEERPSHWHWALNAITGEDPTKPEHRGRLELIAKDWVEWGRTQGYRW